MTTAAMTCESFSGQLMAYLEGETDDATRASLERHAQQCAECAALLAELRALRSEAAGLPELAPSRDLWSGIAARIEAPVVPIGTALPSAEQQVAARRWWRGAMFAASLAGAVGIGYLSAVVRRPDGAVADANLLPPVASTTVSAQLAVATLSADYDREIGRLRKLVDERRNQLDPATVAIIEKNLGVIDVAIVESKKAIAQDPASRFLIESLNQSLESKVELLRIAAALPNRT